MLSRKQRHFLVALLIIFSPATAFSSELSLNVVTTFSILGDILGEIGGQDIRLTTLVGPDRDVHTYEPTPLDVQKLSAASVLFSNGLGFETWLPKLLKSSDFKGINIITSAGTTTRSFTERELHQKKRALVDPHAWQSLLNGIIYAQNIAEGLAAADPVRAATYKKRADVYIRRLGIVHNQIEKMLSTIPISNRKVLTSHDAFGYFGETYGIVFLSATGSSGDAEPSAIELAAFVNQVRNKKVTAVFFENMTSPKIIAQIAQETGARTVMPLYSDALAHFGKPGDTYLKMCEWNARQIVSALKP